MLQTDVPARELEATENTLIQYHQAKLNFPYITSCVKGAFSGFTKAANNKRKGTGSLWAKLRRGKLRYSMPLFQDRKQAWTTVSHLARLDTVRQLSKSDTPASTVYALYKLSNNLPRRDRRQAQKALRTVFRKRRLRTPPTTVQPFMHVSFCNDLQQFLRNRIAEAKQTLPPLHIPSIKLVYKKHPPLQQILHNWRQAHATWHPEPAPTCTCANLQSTVSADHIYNNHIAIQLAELQPQHSFLTYSGKSNTLPKDSHLAAQLTRSIRSWHRRYNIPITLDRIKPFVTQQIKQHRNYSRKHFNIQMVKNVQQQLHPGIIHCEDHFPNRLMWFCPTLYHQAISTTFLDAEVFQVSTTPPIDTPFSMSSLTSLPCYQITHALSNSEVADLKLIFFQKGRKRFGKGRPIVAFVDTMRRRSWEALADVLQLMTKQACPDAFHQGRWYYTTHTNSSIHTKSHQVMRRHRIRSVQSRPCRILYVGQQRSLCIRLSDFSHMVL